MTPHQINEGGTRKVGYCVVIIHRCFEWFGSCIDTMLYDEIITNDKSGRVIGCLAAMHDHLIEEDYISSYVPFVSTVLLLEAKTSEKVSVADVVKRFTQVYGFEIERAPMISILSKCVKKGIISRARHGEYVVNVEQCQKASISEEEVRKEAGQFHIVTSALLDYYKDSFHIDGITEEVVDEKLVLFLNKYSAKTLILDFGNDEIIDSDKTIKNEDHFYVISQFILLVRKTRPDIYELIQSLAMGFLMSSCIAYVDDRDEKSQIDAFKNLIIYVDTPWLLRIIGVYEDDMQEAEIELIKRIKSLGGSLRVFQHTYDETLHILNDCLYWFDNPDFNASLASPALRAFVKRRFSKEDVNEFVNSFDHKLKFQGIDIDSEDYYTGKYYASPIDETVIASTISETYKNTSETARTTKKKTINTDAKSIANILKLWGTKRATTYRQLQHMLVTTNETLAYSSRRLPDGYNRNVINKLYPCITNIYLGTNIWLSAPVKTIKDFSVKKLVSDCLTQIEPNEKLLLALRESIERYANSPEVDEGKLTLLKTKAFSNDYLMNATLGDADRFNDTTREELLERIEEEIREPDRKENRQLSSELKEEKEKRKKLTSISQKSHERAAVMVKSIKNTAWIAIVVAGLSFLLNMSGVLELPKVVVTICSITVLLLAVLEFVFNVFEKRIISILENALLIKNGIIREVKEQTKNDV